MARKKKEKVEAPVVEETVEAPVVEETPKNDENNGEGVSTKTVAPKAEEAPVVDTVDVKDAPTGVKFKRPGHQKMYDKMNPNSRAAEVLVKRFGL